MNNKLADMTIFQNPENKQKIIDAYVSVFGEKYRQYITERMGNIHFAVYGSFIWERGNIKTFAMKTLQEKMNRIMLEYQRMTSYTQVDAEYLLKQHKQLADVQKAMFKILTEHEKAVQEDPDSKYKDTYVFNFSDFINDKAGHVRSGERDSETFMFTDNTGFMYSYINPETGEVNSLINLTLMFLKDAVILHEVFHALTAHKAEKGRLNGTIVGFDFSLKDSPEGNVKNNDDNTIREVPAAFNEICTEWFTIKALNVLRQKGLSILNNDEDNESIYCRGFFALGEFFDTYQSELFEILTTDQHRIKEFIGEENYNNLSEACSRLFVTCTEDVLKKIDHEFMRSDLSDEVSMNFDPTVFKLGKDKKLASKIIDNYEQLMSLNLPEDCKEAIESMYKLAALTKQIMAEKNQGKNTEKINN